MLRAQIRILTLLLDVKLGNELPDGLFGKGSVSRIFIFIFFIFLVAEYFDSRSDIIVNIYK